MKERYLEVTYRKGKPVAAYLYLPRGEGTKSARTDRAAPGIMVDYDAKGAPIGVEITAPQKASVAKINKVLHDLGVGLIDPEELLPLKAA